MPIVTNIECFKGFHNIAQDCYNVDDLLCYIDEYEHQYLCELFGSELAELFITDLLDGVPQSQRFLDVFNKFCKDSSDKCYCSKNKHINISKGIKHMLTGFIYYHYVRNMQYKHTLTGLVIDKHENSESAYAVSLESIVDQKYNDAVCTYQAIQYCMETDKENYPEYNGVCKELKFLDLL